MRKEKTDMKKVVSIVLVLAMILSFSTIAFAHEVTSGVYFGPKENIKANPGETVSFTIEFKSALTADELEGYDKDGTLVIPFTATASDLSMIPIVSFGLTDAAKKVGATIETVDAVEIIGEETANQQWILGKVSIPASYLFTGEALDVFTVEVAVSEDWEVVDYKATFEPYLDFYSGESGDNVEGRAARVVSADGTEMDLYGMQFDAAVISAKPYQPNFFERVWEWIKGKICAVIVLNQTINTLLLNEVFAPADWYQDYLNNKAAEKAAK